MTELLFADNASAALADPVVVTSNSFNVLPTQGAKFPAVSPGQGFYVTVAEGALFEIMFCTGRANDTFQVQRGREGTPARSFSAGAAVTLLHVAASMRAMTQGPSVATGPEKLVGRSNAGRGRWEEIGLQGLTLSGGSLALNVPVARETLGITQMAARLAQALYIGKIDDYFGDLANIPPGWVVCDGTNGTPDLRGLVVVGAGGAFGFNTTGGAESATVTTQPSGAVNGLTGGTALTVGQMPPHTHSGSVVVPPHEHGGVGRLAASATAVVSAQAPGLGVDLVFDQSTGSGGGGTLAITVDSNGSGETHAHQVVIPAHTHSATVPTRPPYRALWKIMFIGPLA